MADKKVRKITLDYGDDYHFLNIYDNPTPDLKYTLPTAMSTSRRSNMKVDLYIIPEESQKVNLFGTLFDINSGWFCLNLDKNSRIS